MEETLDNNQNEKLSVLDTIKNLSNYLELYEQYRLLLNKNQENRNSMSNEEYNSYYTNLESQYEILKNEENSLNQSLNTLEYPSYSKKDSMSEIEWNGFANYIHKYQEEYQRALNDYVKSKEEYNEGKIDFDQTKQVYDRLTGLKSHYNIARSNYENLCNPNVLADLMSQKEEIKKIREEKLDKFNDQRLNDYLNNICDTLDKKIEEANKYEEEFKLEDPYKIEPPIKKEQGVTYQVPHPEMVDKLEDTKDMPYAVPGAAKPEKTEKYEEEKIIKLQYPDKEKYPNAKNKDDWDGKVHAIVPNAEEFYSFNVGDKKYFILGYSDISLNNKDMYAILTHDENGKIVKVPLNEYPPYEDFKSGLDLHEEKIELLPDTIGCLDKIQTLDSIKNVQTQTQTTKHETSDDNKNYDFNAYSVNETNSFIPKSIYEEKYGNYEGKTKEFKDDSKHPNEKFVLASKEQIAEIENSNNIKCNHKYICGTKTEDPDHRYVPKYLYKAYLTDKYEKMPKTVQYETNEYVQVTKEDVAFIDQNSKDPNVKSYSVEFPTRERHKVVSEKKDLTTFFQKHPKLALLVKALAVIAIVVAAYQLISGLTVINSALWQIIESQQIRNALHFTNNIFNTVRTAGQFKFASASGLYLNAAGKTLYDLTGPTIINSVISLIGSTVSIAAISTILKKLKDKADKNKTKKANKKKNVTPKNKTAADNAEILNGVQEPQTEERNDGELTNNPELDPQTVANLRGALDFNSPDDVPVMGGRL